MKSLSEGCSSKNPPKFNYREASFSVSSCVGTATFPSRFRWYFQRLKGFLDELTLGGNTFDLAASMTLLLLMLYSGRDWYLERPITILACAAILHQPLRRSETYWFITTVFLAAGNYQNWFLIDNHKYLITYWSLAVYLSCLTPNPGKTIKTSARLLIGLAFLFATIWKLGSADYLNGAFFHYSLLMDERFASVAAFLGNLDIEAFMHNYSAMDSLLAFNSTLDSIQLQSTLQISILAKLITWWTIFIEGIIAVAFLWPEGKFISKGRDFLLLAFVLTTYLIAPVIGFGWVLVIMGASQSTTHFKYTQLLYILSFFILQIYLIPWTSIISTIVPY
jgi:hypothetical protein